MSCFLMDASGEVVLIPCRGATGGIPGSGNETAFQKVSVDFAGFPSMSWPIKSLGVHHLGFITNVHL